MLKFLLCSITISVTLILNLSILATTGVTQSSPICSTVTSSGQALALDNLCSEQTQNQVPQKAKACQGPFDSDGFPIALFTELEDLEVAVANAEQRNVENTEDSEVQSAVKALLNQMPLSAQILDLLQELQVLVRQAKATKDTEELRIIHAKLVGNIMEIQKNQCLVNLLNSLNKKFPKRVLY